MRRRRSKLEVSTFPFLAVLLCAMGSLLLLLFIMDRRAKIAARNNALEKLEARQARTKAEEEARQAEWEKAKEQLHLSLLQQHELLLAQSKESQQGVNEVSKKLEIVQTKHLDLDQQIKSEAARIAEAQSQIASQRANLLQADQKETMSKAELIEAAKELAELERSLLLLRALKDREKQVYSVVPYRGKRGDLRPPIYVECVRQGVIFHPEKKTLQLWEFTPESLRSEVERRAGTLAANKSAKGPNTDPAGPYVLFLIRPEGITNYYKAQAALRGFQLDFGYELVDEHWVLDFAGQTFAKNAPPAAATTAMNPLVAPLPGMPFGTGAGSGNGGTNAGSIGPVPLSGTPGNGPGGITGSGAGGNTMLPPPPLAMGSGNGPAGLAGVGGGSALPPPPVPGIPGGNAFGPSGVGAGNNAVGPGPGFASGSPSGLSVPTYPDATGPGQGKGPSFVPISKSIGLNPLGPPGISGAGAPEGLDPKQTPTPQMIASAGPPNTSGNGAPQSPGAINVPIPGNSGAAQSPVRSANGQENNGNGQAGGGEPGPAGPLPLPASIAGASKKQASPASPLSKLLGNKDFTITIDCYGDHVYIYPGGTIHRWATTNTQATDQAFVQNVTNLIARRQASVRPGEPPYRPLIRFQVSPEGLRSYYHVYPLLENLRVPMSRENVAE